MATQTLLTRPASTAREVGSLRHPLTWVAAAAALVALAGLLLHGTLSPPSAPTDGEPGAARDRARVSVAVLSLDNASGRGEVAWLGTALAEMLTTLLPSGGHLRAVPRDEVVHLSLERTGGAAPTAEGQTVERIHTVTGADWVLQGSYLALGTDSGAPIRLDLEAQHTQTGETTPTVTVTGAEGELPRLAADVVAQFAEIWGSSLAQEELDRARAALPSDGRATRLYALGVEKLRRFAVLTAVQLLREAVASDPRSPLIRSAFASGLLKLGYEERAQLQAGRALELSRHLPTEQRLIAEGRSLEASRRWDQAAAIHRRLWESFPGDPGHGLRFIRALIRSGSADGARQAIHRLRSRPHSRWDDLRLDLAEAEAAKLEGDFAEQRSFAARAGDKAREIGLKLPLARARIAEGEALLRLGELEGAKSAWNEARQLFDEAGDGQSATRALLNLAYLHSASGENGQAESKYETCLVAFREQGDQRGVSRALHNLAGLRLRRGDLAAALKLYEKSSEIRRKTGDRLGLVVALRKSGEVEELQGHFDAARRLYEEVVELHRELGDRQGEARALVTLGAAQARHDLRPDARTTFQAALALARETGDKAATAEALFGLGELLLMEADLAASRLLHEEALALRTELGDTRRIAQSRVALATLSLESGRPNEGEVLARQASQEFNALGASDSEALAHAIIAWSLREQGEPAEGARHIERALDLVGKTQNVELQISIAITSARILAALGETEAALERLESSVARATEARLSGLDLEARLALGEIEIASGQTSSGHARLARIEKEAAAQGLDLLALKAKQARQQG